MTDVLQAIKDKVHTYPPEVEAYLFGSRARGDARPDSDWDVLLLVDKDKVTDDDFDKYSFALTEMGWDYHVAISPVMFTQKRWKEAQQKTLFYYNVMNDRVRL